MAQKIIIFIFFVAVSFGCGVREQDTEKKEILPAAEQQISGFRVSWRSKQGAKWDLEGASATLVPGNVVLLKDILATIYSEEGPVKVTSDEGSLDRSTNNIELKNNVRALTSDGAKLSTNSLIWIEANELITTNDFVSVERDNIKTTGKGATARVDLQQVLLKEDVKLVVASAELDILDGPPAVLTDHTEKSEQFLSPITVTCTGPLEVDWQNSVAVFNENVHVIDQGRELFADVVTVYFEPEQRGIRKIIAKGNVIVKQADSKLFGDHGVYDASTGKITITGEKQKPKLIFYPNRGESPMQKFQGRD